ncbi:MAG: hypothetical protein KFB93_07235 [Simkaniaceae bacterium]|jgi:hypothetical protein|nr:MAG: hypothetical protein KFB93_07235 [Simkaniaceae bacterium]
MENASPPSAGNPVTNFLYGMVYKEPKKAIEEADAETSTTKEYNWKGISILTAGSAVAVFTIYKVGQAVLKR